MSLPLYHHYPSFSSKTSHFLPTSPPSASSKLPSSLSCPTNPKPSKPLLPSCCSSATPNTETVPKTAIQRIAEKLRNLGYLEEAAKGKEQQGIGHGSAGEIFLPPNQLPKYRVGHTIDASWSTPESPVPMPGSGSAITRFRKIRRELVKQKKKERELSVPPTVAELTIPEEELKRLQTVGIRLDKKLKVGTAGITEGIVNGIHERWRRSELVKIKCEDLCRFNMKRTHEILERKTGGLVVWRSGSIIILYRGANYKYPYFVPDDNTTEDILTDKESSEASDNCEAHTQQVDNSLRTDDVESSVEPTSPNRLTRTPLILGVGSPKKVRFQLPGEMQLEEEADHLLDGLGPRFTDWWGDGPLPVDADLLPAYVPGYRRPFRLLPYGVHPKLTDREMTILRRLGRPLPCHFALGRNRNLQGLAISIVKLWEKCEIAKIAVKRGVQNTNSELMAEELKGLTGGILLSRDREFIVFYRGKDFLPPAVSAAIEERRKHGTHKLEERITEALSTDTAAEHELGPAESISMGDLGETKDRKRDLHMEQRKLKSAGLAVKGMDAKLFMALEKKEKAEKLLTELEKAAMLQEPDVDKEGISEEERYMLRKVGLRMKAFLLLGRRGVFDGTIENMHLHWKYRELVKIISKDRCIGDVQKAARILEAESGGILVAVERVNKGHAIIVYRGKNYQRPANLRPRTLLNKKQAMKRSLEGQRRESLKLHVLKLTSDIEKMKLESAENDKVAHGACIGSKKESDTSGRTDSLEYVHKENAEARGSPEVDAHSIHSIECMDSSSDSEVNANTALNIMESSSPLDPMQDKSKGSLSKLEYELREAEHPELESSSSKPILDEVEYRSSPESLQPQNLLSRGRIRFSTAEVETYVSTNGSRESSLVSSGKIRVSAVCKDDLEDSDVEIPLRAAPLSNRDRLILRKQALKMKKRPVLAVGRNNVITGVAKAIKTHFQKNPLAIVSVKGRAKGTSVQELVFQLQQATGAVLVSQEPNKVILYRGWGEEADAAVQKEKRDGREAWKGGGTKVSPQLLAAVRLECGLQTSQEDVLL